jgi:hypothetical protein
LKRRFSPSARASGEVAEAWAGRGARRLGAIVGRGLVVHRTLGERIAVTVNSDQRARGAFDRDGLDAVEIKSCNRRLDGAGPSRGIARAGRRERLGCVGDDTVGRVDDRRPHARGADVNPERAGHSDPGSEWR